MKEFDVTITEKLQAVVTVQAETAQEAEQMVNDQWRSGDHVLDADNFVDVEFEVSKERELAKEKALSDKTLDVLLVEPGQYPRMISISGELESLQESYSQVRVSDDIAAYMMNLVEATRNSEMLVCGISTRGSLALYRACQILAALRGRDYVIPEDVKQEAPCVLPHRLSLINQGHIDTVQFLQNLLDEVPVPLEKV